MNETHDGLDSISDGRLIDMSGNTCVAVNLPDDIRFAGG